MNSMSEVAGTSVDIPESDERLIVIAGDNVWMHIYPDVKTMLTCDDALAAPPGPVDFFDTGGRRLSPIFTRTWALEGLRQTVEEPDPVGLHRRLCAVVQSVRSRLEDGLTTESDGADALKLALSQLPDLDGQALADCFAALEPNFGHGQPPAHQQTRDPGNLIHVLLCH